MSINNTTKCEFCGHNKVCQYKEQQIEILHKMEGRLDNSCPPDIFDFSFICKEFKP